MRIKKNGAVLVLIAFICVLGFSCKGGEMSPREIFNNLKGQQVVTYGWADMANDGQGLSYADPKNFVLVKGKSNVAKRTAFTNAIASDEPAFIIVSGDVDLSDGKITDDDKSFFDQFDPETHRRVNEDIEFDVGSNTTIIGIDNARLMFGGLKIIDRSNVIIRNITFYDAHGSTEYDTNIPEYAESKASIDALVVEGSTTGVWVDHCRFSDGTCYDMSRNYNHDGLFDIIFGKNITVSWSEFFNHDKVLLIANDDSQVGILDRQITLHHNYFHGTTQRMPRTRGTQMHVYNNYYNDLGVEGNRGYAMGPGMNSHYVVENNFFGDILSGRVARYYDGADYPAIVWSEGNNKPVPRSQYDTGDSKPWEPAYEYTLDPNEDLPTSVPASAGPTLVFAK